MGYFFRLFLDYFNPLGFEGVKTKGRKKGSERMACMHTNTVRIGEVKSCLQCGYTIAKGREPFFDKEIINYRKEREKKSAKNI